NNVRVNFRGLITEEVENFILDMNHQFIFTLYNDNTQETAIVRVTHPLRGRKKAVDLLLSIQKRIDAEKDLEDRQKPTTEVKHYVSYCHQVGKPQSQHRHVSRDEDHPDRNIGVEMSDDGQYLMILASRSCVPQNESENLSRSQRENQSQSQSHSQRQHRIDSEEPDIERNQS
ncbi:MAG: hypothetical protein AAFU49_24805, partial [Pseudomonadota bacterium]